MATPKAITEILAWQKAHQGDVAYSETASTRLSYDSAHLLSPTDCSGMAARMYRHFAGINIGTYTGNECKYGQFITKTHSVAASGEHMLPGDLVFFTWGGHNPAYDHVAIYAGGGRIWNHGGPGHGPLNWSLSNNVWAASEVLVRRVMSPVSPAPVHHDGPYLRHAWPTWMPGGHVFGNIHASDLYHGGVNDREKAAVKLVQQRLQTLGYAPKSSGWADGVWEDPTSQAMHKWNKKHNPHSEHMYSCSHPGWVKLFTY